MLSPRRLLWRLRTMVRRIFGPYHHWSIRRWETPVSDVQRLTLVSLSDCNASLDVTVEASWESPRRRWKVQFSRYPAFRSTDEMHLQQLWGWLDGSSQRCGSTFTVLNSPWIDEVLVDYPIHYVLCTLDDIIEVVSEKEPVWQPLEDAPEDAPIPGKVQHLFLPEDEAEVEKLVQDIRDRQPPGDAG